MVWCAQAWRGFGVGWIGCFGLCDSKDGKKFTFGGHRMRLDDINCTTQVQSFSLTRLICDMKVGLSIYRFVFLETMNGLDSARYRLLFDGTHDKTLKESS